MTKLTFCVPSFVAIANPQLVAMYWLLVVMGGTLLAVRFFVFEDYLDALVLDNNVMHVDVWPALPNQTRSWDDIVQSPLCASPASFHYAWDETHVYAPSGCSRICKNAADADCVPGRMAANRLTGGRNEVFIATLNQVTTRDSSGAVSRHSTFVPEAEQISIGVSFACEGEISRKGLSGEVLELCTWGNNRVSTLVVLLNSRTVGGDPNKIRQVNKTLPVSEGITFTVGEILWLAGIEGGLKDPTAEKESRPASLGGSGAKPPALAVAGMTLRLLVQCHNFLPAELKGQVPGFNQRLHEQVCTVSFVPLRTRWGEFTKFDRTGENGAYSEVYSTGLRIVGMGGGTYTFVDTGSILSYLMYSAILMQIPRIIVALFCTIFIGQLSHIYSRAIFRHFDIEREVAGMATRLLASTITFRQLHRISVNRLPGEETSIGCADRVQRGDRKKITRSTVEKQLRRALRRKTELDGSKVSAFIRFTYQEIAAADQLSVDELNIAHASMETIDFHAICRLFDVDRHAGCLERLFTPAGLMLALFDTSHPLDPAPPLASERFSNTSNASTLRFPKALPIGMFQSESSYESSAPRESVETRTSDSLPPSDGERLSLSIDVHRVSHVAQHVEVEARLELFRQEINSRLEEMSQSIGKVAVTSHVADNAASSLLSERLAMLETQICRWVSEDSPKKMASATSTPVQQARALADGESADADGLSLLELAEVVKYLQLEVRKLKVEVGSAMKEEMALGRQHVRQQPERRESAKNKFQGFSIEAASGSGSDGEGAWACATRKVFEAERELAVLESGLLRPARAQFEREKMMTCRTDSPPRLSEPGTRSPVPEKQTNGLWRAALFPPVQASPAAPPQPPPRQQTAPLPPPPVAAGKTTAQPSTSQRFFPPLTLSAMPKNPSLEEDFSRGPSHAQQEPAPAAPRQPTDGVIGAASAEVARGSQRSRFPLALPARGETAGSGDRGAAALRATSVGPWHAHATAGQARGGDQ